MGPLILLGRSILVVESEPFIACCLQMVLQNAGARVRQAANARESLDICDDPDLSAAVLDFKDRLQDCDLGIARRLTQRALPFLLYGGHAAGRCEAWPTAPVVSRWTSGAEIVESLRALLPPPRSSEPAPPHPMRAMTHIESLMRRRGSPRPPNRSLPRR